jgi:hypothetical protein
MARALIPRALVMMMGLAMSSGDSMVPTPAAELCTHRSRVSEAT